MIMELRADIEHDMKAKAQQHNTHPLARHTSSWGGLQSQQSRGRTTANTKHYKLANIATRAALREWLREWKEEIMQEVLDEDRVHRKAKLAAAGRGHVFEDEGWNGNDEDLLCHGCSVRRLS